MSAGYNPYDYVNYADYLSEGMITVSPYLPVLPGRGNQRFVDKFKSRFGSEPDSFAGMYWNFAWFVKDIFKRSHSADRIGIINAIMETDFQEDRALEKNIFFGGGIKFDKLGCNTRYRPLIIQIQDKQPIIVWPKRNLTGEFTPFR